MKLPPANKRFSRLASAALLCASFGTMALADDSSATYISGAERIAASDTIRSLSQTVAAASCLIDAGADADAYGATISSSIALYGRLMAAMRDGDPNLGINTPEEGRKMLETLRGLSLQWDGFAAAAIDKLAGAADGPGPDYISRHNLNVMHSGKYVVSEVVNQYTIPPALLQGDAFTLDIVARQRSLSQQIAKEACGVITGNATMGNMDRLTGAIDRFALSHNALLNGFTAAGVTPPPTPAIAESLASVSGQWADVEERLREVTGPGDLPLAESIYDQLAAITASYDALVNLYVISSKSGI